MTRPDEHLDPPKADAAGEPVAEERGLQPEERELLVPDLLARRFQSGGRSYWQIVWNEFKRNVPAVIGLWVIVVMGLMAILAPLLANHRPFFMVVRNDVPGYEPGVYLPLFSQLNAIDWMLLLGLPMVLIPWWLFQRARRRGARMPLASVLTIAGLIALPMVLTLIRLVVDRGAYEVASSGGGVLFGKAGWWWGCVGLLIVVGGVVSVPGLLALARDKRDALGRRVLGGATFSAVIGGVLMLAGVALVATIPVKSIDLTNYQGLAERDDVWMLAAPLQHDYLGSSIYVRYQPPFGPYTKVLPSGGSMAAVDLGLTEERRAVDISAELASGEQLTLQTSLDAFREGEGVRRREGGGADFIIIARNLEDYRASLAHAQTVEDVIAAVEEASNGIVQLSIKEDGSGFELIDHAARTATNLLGTDASGSDVASRLIYATRVALSIGFVSTSIAIFIGVTLGALMGYFGGWVDIAGMRLIEIFMAIPRLFLLLTVIAFIPPALNQYMLFAMMVVIGLFSWMNAARFIRAEFLRLREQDFIQAAKACGLPLRSILFKHMLPNGVTPVLVDASFGVAAAIFVETNLSFLGFGIKPPNPSWGKMLAGAVNPSTGVFYWWMAIFPGMMIFLTVFAFNIVADALRDAIDPKLKKAAH